MFWFWFNLIAHILMVIANIAWWIVAFRLTQNRFWRAALSIFLGIMLAALIGFHIPNNRLIYGPKAFVVSVIVWHHIALGAGAAALAVWAAMKLFSRARRKNGGSANVGANPADATGAVAKQIARREFIGACAAAAPVLLTVGFTGLAMKQITSFRVRRMTLGIPRLPRALDGLTIAHVSDIHVGRITCGRVLRDMVNTTNNLRPDLVLLTGDLINYELSDLSEAIGLVKDMPGKYGHWMIEGNHDLLVDGGEFRSRVRDSGIPFLLNEAATADVRGYPVQFFGTSWTDAHGAELDKIIGGQLHELMKRRNPDAFPIFLAHHPHAFDAAARENLPLTLSGHTHGGQLMLSSQYGVGPVLFRYWSGLYKKGNSQMVVSNGVGNMFPIRVNAPAEIVHLTLRCA